MHEISIADIEANINDYLQEQSYCPEDQENVRTIQKLLDLLKIKKG